MMTGGDRQYSEHDAALSADINGQIDRIESSEWIFAANSESIEDH